MGSDIFLPDGFGKSEQNRIKLFNIDCMKGMLEYPDKHFELAIVDPPLGWDNEKPTPEYFQELRQLNSKNFVSRSSI
jgi:DNA modification methylase